MTAKKIAIDLSISDLAGEFLDVFLSAEARGESFDAIVDAAGEAFGVIVVKGGTFNSAQVSAVNDRLQAATSRGANLVVAKLLKAAGRQI